MDRPPFRFAGTALGGGAVDATLRGAVASLLGAVPATPPAPPAPRRARLAELDGNLHCSLIGTCLGTAALRKLMLRCDAGLEGASDLELHHAAVQMAHDGGAGAKALHKALDTSHAAALQRFAPLTEAQALERAWQQALASGEVPGAYWALMTHAHATPALRKKAFGDVHMLSHLVGAANRADIRRLQALEQHNTRQAAQLDRQQLRLQAFAAQCQALDARCAAQQRELDSLRQQAAAACDLPAAGALAAERASHEQALAHQTRRREAAESLMLDERQARLEMQSRLGASLDLVAALQAELQALEAQWDGAPDPAASDPATAALRGRRVVYVGGRPGANQRIRAMVERAGGELVLHDGGLEDRKGLLAAALPRADLVVFPVDCVDHDSAGTVKRLCERHGVPFHPVRSASAASFAALLQQLAAPADADAQGPRRCLRHG